MKNFFSFVVVLFCLGAVQVARAATLCYGFTKVEGVRTNGVNIKAVYQNDTSIVLDTVSYRHPSYEDGYFHMSQAGTLPVGKYDVHFEYGSYLRNKVITYDPETGPVNMGDVELVRVEYTSNDTIIILRNIDIEAVFWRQSGVIRDLSVKGHTGLLSANEPGQIIFRDTLIAYEYQQNSNGTVTHIDSNISPNRVRVIFEINFQYHKALVNYTMDTLTLRWDNDVWLKYFYPSEDERALRLDFSLPLLDAMHYAFWTDKNAPFLIETYFNKTIKYRQNRCVLPGVILYDTTLDYGISFVCPFEVKKPALSFKLKTNPSSDSFRVSYNYLRMGESTDRHAQASLYIVPHKGDWRPGLAWMRDQYPEYFNPHPNSQVLEHEGRFFFGMYHTPEAKMDTCQMFGVKWEEFYHHQPFFGIYAPQDRSGWYCIRDGDSTTFHSYEWWLNQYGPYGYDSARTIINAFDSRGIGSYMYFQSCEAWKNWVYNDTLPFPCSLSLAKDKNGNPLPHFEACRLLNPDTNLYSSYPLGELSWAGHIDSQVVCVLDSYPDAVGIFYDRDDYCSYDYAHDDSVTMIYTSPVYMLGFALEEINKHICEEVHNRNKGILTNGPTSVEVCKNIDGIMVERHTQAVGYMQYLGLSRPLILFVIDKTALETETKDKAALYGGCYPSLEADVNEPMSRIIDLKYQPLFDLYKGKTWVLNAHALRLPTGIKGNIFKALNNDLLIPMVSLEKSQVVMDPFAYNLGVEVTVPGLGEYDHCYLLSGDFIGPRWVVYDPGATDMRLMVPEHMVSTLIRLSKEPRYEYSQMSSSVLCRGKAGKFKLRVQNLESGSKHYALLITTPFGNCSFRTFWLRQYKVSEIQYDFTIPDTHPLGEDSFWVINTAPEPDDSTLFTIWVYNQVSLELPERLFIKFPISDSFPLILTNNTSDSMSVTLTGAFTQGHGEITFIGNNPVTLIGHETKEMAMRLELKDTVGTLQITATSKNDTVGSLIKAVERAMRPTPGDIFFDDFNREEMDGQWDMWGNPNAWSIENSSAKGSGNYSSHFATVGADDANWSNYRYQVNTKMEGSTNPNIQYLKSYLFCRVQNDTQYYRYGIKGDEPRLVLYRRDSLHGWTRLGTYDFQPQKNIWYNLAVEVEDDSIRCFLNGERVIAVRDSDTQYNSGGIGIGVTEDNMTVYYDDIVVRPLEPPDTLFADNFDSGAMDILWNKRQGTWFVPPEEPSFARGSGMTHFATVAEGCDWTNYRYQVRTRIKGSDLVSSLRAYIFFRVQDEQNYYRFGMYSGTGIELYKRVDGEWIFLANCPFDLRKNIWYSLKVEIQSNNQIKGYLNDSLRITYTDDNNPFLNGGIGIGVLEPEDMITDYDDVLLQPMNGQ
ncbi:hypothetical protein KAX97_14725 [candidate division WOR-3 bacterium]|nr:hypothetical protein [candidate division WOR-3 bacterium]